MNESLSSNLPEPKKVGVWTEGARIEPNNTVKMPGQEYPQPTSLYEEMYGCDRSKRSKKYVREFIIPKNSPESSDDIPTIPDLDDLQDILEKEIAKPPPTNRKDSETVNTLAAVGDGYSGAADGVEAALAALKARVPAVRPAPDAVWTVDSLLAQLAEEGTDLECLSPSSSAHLSDSALTVD